MRNLKRALSLALASIMLLGMMVTGAGAASNSFTDFDQIVNQEAAEVTSGLGIFDGYTDGSFGPEKVVTRAEMAVIICKLLNGSDVDPGNFTGISKFTDVPAWAEGYVNYCAASGIVVGVGEGKFNPSATVTTVEAATMLLKALGYFTEEDKLKEDWKTVVTGRATGMKLYGALTLSVDEGLTRDNVAELVFNTLFAQRVAYDDNRQLYVKNTNRDVVVTNGTQDYLNTFAENTFHMWVVDGLVTANSFTNDDLSETTNNAPRTNVVFDEAAAQDYPATAYQGSTGSEYPFEYTTGLDMIGHAARVYYRMERNAPVVFAIADRATKVEYITYDANETNLSNAANEAGFRRNTIRQISEDDYKVNYAWDVTVGTLKRDSSADNDVDLTGSNKWEKNDPAKTLLVISNSTDNAVDYVIVLDQYLDTVKRVVTKNDVTEYDLTTIDGVDQNILHGDAAQGDYVVVTDIGKQGDMLNFELAEKVSANITKITGKSDDVATVKSIIADGTTYVGSPVYDFRPQNSSLEDTTDFEAIETIGEATLLLDAQGKCIGLAQPESTPNYAYAAQFGVWHTGGSLNTEFKLTVKLYFLDGTSGVYLVNTDASKSSNTFYDLKMGVDETIAEGYRDMLNGVDKEHGVPYSPLKTYDPQHIGVTGTTLNNLDETKESGLGIYKATVRADDTVVLKALGGNEVAQTFGDNTKLITGHSTLVKGNGQNLTAASGDVLFQNNKTVYFYVSGTYDDLSVGAKYGVNNAVSVTNSKVDSAKQYGEWKTVDGKDKFIVTTTDNKDADNNGESDVFAQILTAAGGRKYEEKKETVEAVLVWGYDLGSSDTMYFYRQNSYDIEHKDNASSRAGEKLYTITYHMYTADGEPYEAHFDNGGKYYDMETAKETVSDKPTGFYTLGSKDINGKWTSNETDKIFYVKNNVDIGTTDGAKNVYVLNAVAKHDTYVDNLYTHVEDVGGIIPSTAKVVSTVDNCNFDSINEIARACDNGALVKISYCYSTSDYKIKTVFITEYNKEGGTIANAGADLWSYYSAPWLYVFNDISKPASYIEVANSAKAALEKAGFTVTNMQPAGMTQNSKVFWTIEATMGGTKYFFTNGPTGMGFGTNGFNYYVNIVRETVRVRINGNIATNGGVVKEGYCLPNTTIRVSDKTVVTGNVYDVMRNNGANYAFVKEDSVTATNNQIVYSLLPNIEGYTVDFVTKKADTDAVIGTDEAVNDKVPEGKKFAVTFENGENETPAQPGDKLGGKMSIQDVAPSRALADGTFDADKTYTLTFGFSGTSATQEVEGTVVNANTLSFEVTIPTDAVADKETKKITITLKDIVESEKTGKPGEIAVNAGDYTVAPTKITEAGETTITITVPTGDNKTYSVTYKGEKYEAVNGKIEIPVTVTEEELAAGTPISFAVDAVDNTPLPENETIKATVSGSDVTFSAYWPDGTAPTLTEDEIKAAVTAAGREVASVDLTAKKVVLSNGRTLSFGGAADGGYKNPTRLYKVTTPVDVQYIKANETLTGLGAIKALLPKETLAGASNAGVAVANGTSAAITSLTADVEYVEALPVASGSQSGAPDSSNTKVFDVFYTDAEGMPTTFSSTAYIQKGLELTFYTKTPAKAGMSFTLTVNGEEIPGTFDDKGEASVTKKISGVGADGEVSFLVTMGYTVTYGSQTFENKAVGDKVLVDLADGMTLVCEKTTGLTKLGTSATAVMGKAQYVVAAADQENGVIALVAAYEVSGPQNTPAWVGYTDAELTEAISTTNSTPTYVLPGEAVYVKASAKNTILKLADGVEGLTLEPVKVPSQFQEGVWKVAVNGKLVAANIEAGLGLPDDQVAAISVENATAGAGTTDVETTAKIAVSSIKNYGDEEVSAKWVGTPGKDAVIGTVAYDESDGIVVNLTVKEDAGASDVIGTLLVKVGTMEFEIDVKGKD